LSLYPMFIYYFIRKGNGNVSSKNTAFERLSKTATLMLLGGCALILGTFILVYSAIIMAEIFGLSHFYAGFTIMALGCVVPEIAVSVAAAIHGEHEISISNVLGDNIITMTLVLGTVGLIRSFRVMLYDILLTVPSMILVTFVLYVISVRSNKITRTWSLLMLIIAAGIFVIETFNRFA